MKRLISDSLLLWKNSAERKPLIVKGARQTGKTWIIKQFGERNFRKLHYVNFENAARFVSLFSGGLQPKRILAQLALLFDEPIDTARDLVFFDEAQCAPEALTALKYFREEQPDLALVAAGSHIGLTVSKSAFPVGQVEFLTLYPLSFAEFILAARPALSDYLEHRPLREPIAEALHDDLMRQFRAYTVVGGMPEAVKAWCAAPQDNPDPLGPLQRVREIQAALAQSYASDFAKHAGKTNATDIARLFDGIPAQLARTVDGSFTRYRFKDALPGKTRFSAIAGPLDWLIRTGLALKVALVERPDAPLSAFAVENLFKLYLLDVGLLGAMAGLLPRELLVNDFGTYKGWVAENFVAQELTASNRKPLYFWRGKISEIDFLIATDLGVVPVEVKSGALTRSKSLAAYAEKFKPPSAIRLSGRNPSFARGAIIDLPLYLAGQVNRYLAPDGN
jgi:predicted AAA+ superfamily ATPase